MDPAVVEALVGLGDQRKQHMAVAGDHSLHSLSWVVENEAENLLPEGQVRLR
jgi:hypothetical protein